MSTENGSKKKKKGGVGGGPTLGLELTDSEQDVLLFGKKNTGGKNPLGKNRERGILTGVGRQIRDRGNGGRK